jgi:hypothetical protein
MRVEAVLELDFSRTYRRVCGPEREEEAESIASGNPKRRQVCEENKMELRVRPSRQSGPLRVGTLGEVSTLGLSRKGRSVLKRGEDLR